MDYFSKFLHPPTSTAPKIQVDRLQEFHKSWNAIKDTLMHPDERQLTRGIGSTDVAKHLRSMADSLVWESTRVEDGGTGACLEYLLKNDVLGTLVRLSECDRPAGIQAEVLRTISNMVVLLDEQFLVHSAVHKAVLRLLRTCVGDDLQEQLDGRNKAMGAAGNVVRAAPSEHEEDLVNLLCILCSRIRTYRELLMIFFHDKHWYRSEPLFSVEEEEEEEDEDEEDGDHGQADDLDVTLTGAKPQSDTQSSSEASSTPPIPTNSLEDPEQTAENKRPEYEFLLFNYLLRFVHREGHIGEFARAGLLFLMDVAMSPGEPDNIPANDTKSQSIDPVNDAALALAEYILDGDFSDVLGAGLGAVYSLLPTKLGYFPQIDVQAMKSGMKIGDTSLVSDEEKEKQRRAVENSQKMGIEDARGPEFRPKIDHFLTLLVFIQDVLRRNVEHDGVDASALVGTAIVQSILDAVRRIFLENVLYTSILECSDNDGSAVAVMSYIDVMVRTLRDGPLANLLIEFLVSEDSEDPRFKQRTRSLLTLTHNPPSAAEERKKKNKRRQSSAMTLLEMEAPESRKQSDYFKSSRFTLKDLLTSNLRSRSQTTAISALQLLQTMLVYHPVTALKHLLLVIPDSKATSFPHPAILHQPQPPNHNHRIPEAEDDEDDLKHPGDEPDYPLYLQPQTTFSTHEREMSLYLALVSRVDPSHDGDIFSTGYDHYLQDALLSIQNQPLYWKVIENPTDMEERIKHRLNIYDPMLTLIIDKLTTFFHNLPEFNVGLTGVLATLAIHPDRSLAGWLTFAIPDESSTSTPYAQHPPYDDGDDRSMDFGIAEKLAHEIGYLPAASLDKNSRPIIHTIFYSLISQLEQYRHTIGKFDKYLLERRRGLLFSENLTDALSLALDLSDERKPTALKLAEDITQKSKPKPRTSTASSFVSFLSPRKTRVSKPVTPPPEPASVPHQSTSKTVSVSPFGSHYQQTGKIQVEPLTGVLPIPAHWTPSQARKSSVVSDDIFGSAWGEIPEISPKENEDMAAPLDSITLSQLLDNVVILEESIKELVAIIHARRSLGIDSVRYL